MTTTNDERDENTPGSERLKAKSPFEFFRQVQQESKRVTWATRQEVYVTTIMVSIMVVAAALFLWLVDSIIRLGVGAILNLS
jgi:preprotein translocase subunit SecE